MINIQSLMINFKQFVFKKKKVFFLKTTFLISILFEVLPSRYQTIQKDIFPENFSSRKFHWTWFYYFDGAITIHLVMDLRNRIDAKFSRTKFLERHKIPRDSRGTRGSIGS